MPPEFVFELGQLRKDSKLPPLPPLPPRPRPLLRRFVRSSGSTPDWFKKRKQIKPSFCCSFMFRGAGRKSVNVNVLNNVCIYFLLFFPVLCWFFLKTYIYIYDNCGNWNHLNLNTVIDMMLFGVSCTVVKHPCWTCRVKQHNSNVINTNNTLWSSCLLFVFTHFIINALWPESPPATPPSFLFGPRRRAARVKHFGVMEVMDDGRSSGRVFTWRDDFHFLPLLFFSYRLHA